MDVHTCVHVCMYMFVGTCVCVCVNVCGSQRIILGVPTEVSSTYIYLSLSLWLNLSLSWNLSIVLDRLAREYQGSTCFCLSSAGITGVRHPPWILNVVSGDRTSVTVLVKQELCSLSSLPSTDQGFKR